MADLPRPSFKFRTTAGEPARAAYAEPYQPQPIPQTEVHAAGAKVALSPTQGPVGTHAMLRGEGFPRILSLQLVWQTSVGSRVSGNGFDPKIKSSRGESGQATDGLNPVSIPEDLGGLHGLALRERRRRGRARAFFVIETSIVSITPKSGPAGTPVTIHLKGVGWTEYDNIYVATYDNAYMGYVCGFNSQGDVVINFTAAAYAGRAPDRFVSGNLPGSAERTAATVSIAAADLCGRSSGQQDPALRFTFEIVPPGARTTTSTRNSADPS